MGKRLLHPRLEHSGIEKDSLAEGAAGGYGLQVAQEGSIVFVRSWSARATPEGAESYRRHFEDDVLPSLRAIAGQRGALLLRRADGAAAELVVLTFWDSMDAIRAFAGTEATTRWSLPRPALPQGLRSRGGDLRSLGRRPGLTASGIDASGSFQGGDSPVGSVLLEYDRDRETNRGCYDTI